MLSPSRFVFRNLELPRGAEQFLEGVVRSQIDRLTPWIASEAAFGWSPPSDAGPDRIAVIVAATDRALIEPFVNAVVTSRADSVQVSTLAEGASTVIPVWFQHTDQRADRRLRRYLAIGFGVAARDSPSASRAGSLPADILKPERQNFRIRSRSVARSSASKRERRSSKPSSRYRRASAPRPSPCWSSTSCLRRCPTTLT